MTDVIECPSCGDPIEGEPSFLGTCQGSGACMRIERFRALAAGEPDPMGTPREGRSVTDAIRCEMKAGEYIVPASLLSKIADLLCAGKDAQSIRAGEEAR